MSCDAWALVTLTVFIVLMMMKIFKLNQEEIARLIDKNSALSRENEKLKSLSKLQKKEEC